MTAIEELTSTIRTVTDTWDEPLDDVHDLPPIVNAIIAAGWESSEAAAEHKRQAIAYNSTMWRLAVAIGLAKSGEQIVELDIDQLVTDVEALVRAASNTKENPNA